jgi:ELWxxDGT repeat protein
LALEHLEDRVVPSVTLVKDINTYTNNSNPTNVTNVNGTAFFTASTNDGTVQLFKSDGTAGGTTQLTAGSRLYSFNHLIAFNNKLFFYAFDNTLGNEALWTSDGTVAGTAPFLADNQNVNPITPDSPEALVGSKLFFQANDPSTGKYDLWVSNGANAGTHPVQPNSATAPTRLLNFTNVNGKLYFDSFDSSTGNYTLWTSDGTSGGTSMVTELTPNFPNQFTAVGSKLYFQMYDSAHSTEALWKSDGTSAGTVMVGDLPNAGSVFTAFNGNLYFQIFDTTDAPNTSYALWKSNGTTVGAFTYGSSHTPVQVDGITPMVVFGGALYLRGYDTTNGYSLWKTDGVPSNNNTATVQSAGSSPFNSQPSQMTVAGSQLFFVAVNASDGGNLDLWKTDGTSAGTTPVQTSGFGRNIYALTPVGNKVFYGAYDVDANGNSPHGTEPWVSDGTSSGTSMIIDINTTTSSSSPNNFVAVGNEVFFTAKAPSPNGRFLWQSDGTAANTVPVQTSTATVPTSEENFTAVGNNLFFTAAGSNGYDLWQTSTATNSAVEVLADSSSNPFAGNFASSDGSSFVNLNGTLYFGAFDAANSQWALWKSDGTPGGTVVVADIDPGNSLRNLTVVGNNLFWSNYDSAHNAYALWEYNGTTASLVQDIGAGSLTNLTAVGSNVYFQTLDSTTSQYFLYTSNGITTTQLIGSGSVNPFVGFASFNSKLYFGEDVSGLGYEMVTSDGTVAGTTMFQTTNSLPVFLASNPYFTTVGSQLYFAQGDTTLGVTDGTAAGTGSVQGGGNNITLAKNVAYLANDNGTLVFQGTDSAHGSELWQSDGTAAGTQLSADIVTGAGSSSPAYLTVAGSQVFFQATDSSHGSELWSATIAPTVVTASISGPTSGVTEQHRPFVLTANDSNPANNSAGFSFVINWGDGTSQTVSGQSGLSTDHQYATVSPAAVYLISVTATNLADNVTSAAVTQTVAITQTAVQGGNVAVGGVAGSDAYVITRGTASGSYTVKLNGIALLTNYVPSSGQQVFLYSGNGTTTITINDTGTFNDAFTLGADFVTFLRTTFVVAQPPATWTVNGNSGNDTFTISGAASASIVAGNGNNTFKVVTGGSLSGTITGGAGINTLDYSGYATSGVVVDLPLGSATGIDGGASGGIANIRNVTGSSAGGDILVGDGNTNVLKALKHHNILIGGSGGGDTLTSGGADILIAGTTSYDTNIAALQFILGEWKTSTPANYTTVINNIETSATDPLNTTTVTDAGSPDLVDTLTGKGASKADWFFAHTAGGSNPNDTITGAGSGDITTSI